MQVPNPRSAAFWKAVPPDVVLAVAMASVLFNQGKLIDGGEPQAKPSAKVTPAKVESFAARSRGTVFVATARYDGKRLRSDPLGRPTVFDTGEGASGFL